MLPERNSENNDGKDRKKGYLLHHKRKIKPAFCRRNGRFPYKDEKKSKINRGIYKAQGQKLQKIGKFQSQKSENAGKKVRPPPQKLPQEAKGFPQKKEKNGEKQNPQKPEIARKKEKKEKERGGDKKSGVKNPVNQKSFLEKEADKTQNNKKQDGERRNKSY